MNIDSLIEKKQKEIRAQRDALEESRKRADQKRYEQHQLAYKNTVEVILDALKRHNFTYQGNPIKRVYINQQSTAMPSLRVVLRESMVHEDTQVGLHIEAWNNKILTGGLEFAMDQTEEAVEAFMTKLIEICD